jgi:hypothetical protein
MAFNSRFEEFVQLKFLGTYGLVNRFDIATGPDQIVTSDLSDYFSSAIYSYIRPFRRWSALHRFAEYYVQDIIDTNVSDFPHRKYVRNKKCSSSICRAVPAGLFTLDLLEAHELDVSILSEVVGGWNTPDICCPKPDPEDQPSVGDEAWENWLLSHERDVLCAQLAEEMFFILFNNREFLARFNEHLALRVSSLVVEDDEANPPKPDGTPGEALVLNSDEQTCLRRASPPDWAKRAVFFRDRGYCCTCGRNLNQNFEPVNHAAYDHIVPLRAGGLNDVTNLQLLCQDCNSEKGPERREANSMYQRWYPLSDQERFAD